VICSITAELARNLCVKLVIKEMANACSGFKGRCWPREGGASLKLVEPADLGLLDRNS
jgi:hypothetical protein